ncbi:hypothetical protein JVX98_31655 (plasmid) [Ensifer sp. PDNC004]|uniref:GNAT family N-acetyltransferase n=1 Tax=Ensifer sp. PDNC004 TaxID=2811423 RepID=UPI0019627FAB|nr:hypothetical protein [Ensifer sp. PDNC004]QRY70594.1 hypothetical protein JVX98_31655 [Ensifer sp. PDNC004]
MDEVFEPTEDSSALAAVGQERGLRVRLLEERDTEAVRDIIKQHHSTTVFRDQTFSDWKLNEHFNTILSRPPRMVCPVAILDGRPIGVAWAIADSYMLTDGPLFVTVHVIAVDLTASPVRRAKVFLALVAAVRHWAATLNASHSFIHVTTGSNIKATDRLMKAAGAEYVGGAYVA